MFRWLSKKEIISILSILLLVGIFFVAKPVDASAIGDAVAKVLGWIIYALVYVIGLILMLVMWVLIKVAQFNDFINAEPVVYGWAIVRDLCNMFFILILLIISFATIFAPVLGSEQYSFKKMLPKLIIMAILINFSKTICGILIDFAQIIMLTFVNGFKEIGAGNLTNMLGIDKLMSLDPKTSDSGDVNLWSITGSMMLALIYATVALIVIITMLAMLVMRMVMIWVYVVLSPLAYLLSAVPGGQKYASQWWEEFSKNLIVGPVLAFFIWLSFASLGGVSDPNVVNEIKGAGQQQSGAESQLATSTDSPTAGVTEAGSPDHMIKFIISIAMLLGGLMISQQIGGQAGSIAGKGMARMQKMGTSAMKGVGVGLKRATGVERVQMAYKSYKDMKAADRSQRARDDAVKANKVIGKVKETAAKPFNKLEDYTTSKIASVFGGKKQKAAEAEKVRLTTAKEENAELTGRLTKTYETTIKDSDKKIAENNKEETTLDAEEETLNTEKADINARRGTRAWTVADGLRVADIDARVGDIHTRRDDIYTENGRAITDRNLALSNLDGLKKRSAAEDASYDSDISKTDEKISKYQGRQAKVKKWTKRGLAASLGIGAAFTGIGAPGGVIAALGTILGGGAAGLKIKSSINSAGKDNLRRATSYNTQKISAQKEALKFMKPDKLLETIKNSTDHHEQAAATMLALEKGDVFSNSTEAGMYKKRVADRFKGDDRVNGMLDASSEKKYPEHVAPISELKGAKADEASKKIVDNLGDGVTKISDLSAAAIDAAIKDIAAGLKDKTFQSQYDSSSDKHKDVIQKALDKEIVRARNDLNTGGTPEEIKTKDEQLYKAKKKQAYAKGNNIDVFGPSYDTTQPEQVSNKAHKDKYLEEMKDEEITKVIDNKDNNQSFFRELAARIAADPDGRRLDKTSKDNKAFGDVLAKFLKNSSINSETSKANGIINKIRKNTGLI